MASRFEVLCSVLNPRGKGLTCELRLKSNINGPIVKFKIIFRSLRTGYFVAADGCLKPHNSSCLIGVSAPPKEGIASFVIYGDFTIHRSEWDKDIIDSFTGGMITLVMATRSGEVLKKFCAYLAADGQMSSLVDDMEAAATEEAKKLRDQNQHP